MVGLLSSNLVRLGHNRTVVLLTIVNLLVTRLPMPITLIMSSRCPMGGGRGRGISAGQIDSVLLSKMVVVPARDRAVIGSLERVI